MPGNGLLFTPEIAEMMARCGEAMKCECGSMMQEMMKGAFGKPEQK